jgi:DNA-binding beta-propeller fold protein YncE
MPKTNSSSPRSVVRARRSASNGSPVLDVTTILNSEELADYEKDRDGSDAALYQPTGIALDPSGKVYFVDTGGNKIHRIDKQAQITQVYPKRYSEAYVTTLCGIVLPAR